MFSRRDVTLLLWALAMISCAIGAVVASVVWSVTR